MARSRDHIEPADRGSSVTHSPAAIKTAQTFQGTLQRTQRYRVDLGRRSARWFRNIYESVQKSAQTLVNQCRLDARLLRRQAVFVNVLG